MRVLRKDRLFEWVDIEKCIVGNIRFDCRFRYIVWSIKIRGRLYNSNDFVRYKDGRTQHLAIEI